MNIIRVLLIDDDDNDSVLTQALLNEVQSTRYEITCATNYDAGLMELKRGGHDVCLLDNKLGPHTGLEILEEARRLQQPPPVIFLTGSDAPDLDARALELGGADYLVKGHITPMLLDRSIRYAIGRRRAEEKLRASDERFRSLSAAASDAIIVATSDGRIDSWNHAAEIMFGYPAAEAIGQPLPFLMPERYRAAHAKGMAQFRDGAPRAIGRTVELHGLRKDGTEFPVEMALSSWRTPDGLFFGAILRDITRRKAEAEALQKAKEAAEHAMYARSAFLANMSHEIRTPMNGVIGMTSVLLETDLAPEQREYVDIIRHSGETLLVLINDILDFSKIESGKVELEQQSFDLADCIEESLALFRAQAHEKGIELLYLIHPGVPKSVIGDVTRLRQILTNLISNAVKFTSAGEVEVAARPYPGEPKGPGALIAFSVRDTGIGIPPGSRHRLFQYFSQIDASTTRQFGGTGLGLAISKRLCELMGGTMDVESTAGVGSTFRFTVNLRLPADAQVSAAHQALGSLAGRRVLVVDDNATNRLILRLYLEGWGAECVDVPSAEQAIRRLATDSRFDVFLLDFEMPECDGLQLAARLRVQNFLAPILVLTSGSREDIRERPERPSVNRVLEKPIKPLALYQVIAEELGSAMGARGSESNSPVFIRVASQHPLSILLAEDNSVNQLVAQRILGRLGYRVDTVANGAEVLQAFRQRSYEVVLMDVQMPEMDGIQATIELRARPEIRQPWIIAMTASAMSGDRERYLEAGMNDYVAKPVTLQDVADALKRAWNQGAAKTGDIA